MRATTWILAGWWMTAAVLGGEGPTMRTLTYAPAPVDNPLKGLVPYAGDRARWFPHSMEFSYLPLSRLVIGEDRYDWHSLDQLLHAVAGRGHQTVFRIYLEYPGKPSAIPTHLVERGLIIHRWEHEGRQLITPDYANPDLRRCLQLFIAALGERYDGDPRVGFITAGLLGKWGEWHTHPRNDLWADKDVQGEVMNAYAAAFRKTPILYRYPAGPGDNRQAENASRPVGYHDDSFAWATLETGKASDAWFYQALIRRAGEGAGTRWKTQPIGGEIRPEAWGEVFDEHPSLPQIQDFMQCVGETHVSWLMDSGMFTEKHWSESRRARASDQVRRMGYELYVPRAGWRVADGSLHVSVELENRGVAPFYYDWPVEFALLSGTEPITNYPGAGSVRGQLPGESPRIWRETLPLVGIGPGTYQLALRIPNPMTGGKPLRFANHTQSSEPDGWLWLGDVDIQ